MFSQEFHYYYQLNKSPYKGSLGQKLKSEMETKKELFKAQYNDEEKFENFIKTKLKSNQYNCFTLEL